MTTVAPARSHRGPGGRADRGAPIVVVGASGYAGGHLCAALQAADVAAVAASRSGCGPLPTAVTLDPLACEPRELGAVLRRLGARTVVNAAGCVWSSEPDAMRVANVELVERLVAALGHLGHLDRPRLVQLGTVHEYGAGTPGRALAEHREPHPVTDYGRTKLRATEAVVRARDRGTDATVLRVSNSIGAGLPATSLLGGLAARLRAAALAGGDAVSVELPDLSVRRDFVDMDDVAAAALAAAAAPEVPPIVNVGSGRAVAVRSVVDRLFAVSGLDVHVTRLGTGKASADDQCLDVTLAARAWGWAPRVDLDTSLRRLLGAQP